MKDYSVIKKRVCELDNTVGETVLDASGPTLQDVDYNFDLLRKKYDGTDFSKEANCMCDLMGLFTSRCKDKEKLPYLVNSISGLLRGDGFEDQDDIMERYSRFVDEVTGMLNQKPMQKAVGDVNGAQAKLMELENYINSMGLKRDKWNRYVTEARKMAAVGDDSFDAAPELEQDDLAYMQERDRKKQRIMQNMVVV